MDERLQMVSKSIEDVETKIANKDELSSGYSKLKSKLISESWQRIMLKHEECEVDCDEIPLEYEVLLQDVEIAMEHVLITLHKSLDEQKVFCCSSYLK